MTMYDCNKNGNSSFGAKISTFLVVVAIFYLIGTLSEANEPKCIKSGCDNKQTTNSSYCYIHKPYTSSYSYSNGSSSYSNKTTESSSETNRKKLINGNGFVFGVPVSGKSFFCKAAMGQVFFQRMMKSSS